jgi:hypothetical protein
MLLALLPYFTPAKPAPLRDSHAFAAKKPMVPIGTIVSRGKSRFLLIRQGHGIGVALDVYTTSSFRRKGAAAKKLENGFSGAVFGFTKPS